MTEDRHGHLRSHRVFRVEYRPYRVPYLVDGDELKTQGSGVRDIDAEWLIDGNPYVCVCGVELDTANEALEHLRTVGDVERAVVDALAEHHNAGYVALAVQFADDSRSIGPLQGAREEGLDVTEANAATIADRFAEACDQQTPELVAEAMAGRAGGA